LAIGAAASDVTAPWQPAQQQTAKFKRIMALLIVLKKH
jgi:hypothetical protein